MELRAFNHHMGRLSSAFNHTLPSHAMTVYWERLQKHSEPAFEAAVNRLLDSQERFPPIGKIKDALRTGAELGARASDAPPVTVTPVDPDDIDRPRTAKKTPHAVGSRAHDAFLRNSLALMHMMEVRLNERAEEMKRDPSPDLERRILVLTRTLARQYEWHEHFERTGESLIEEEPKAGDRRRLGCQTCGGVGIVRKELPLHHPDFGKAFLCPDCRGGGPALKNGGH